MRPSPRRTVRDGLEWCGVLVLAVRVIGQRLHRLAVVCRRLRRLALGRQRVPA
jgi:hypothetical protein